MRGARKGFSLLVVMIFVLSMVLSGCGAPANTASTTSAAAQTAQQASTVTDNKLPPYEITFYSRGKGPEKDDQMVVDAANKFLTEKINATLKLNKITRAQWNQKMSAVISSGEVFDITFTSIDNLPYVYFAQRGAFVPLNDPANNLLDKYAPKTKALLGPDYLGGSAIKGINYAIPTNKEKAHSYGMELRKDLVAKYNFDISNVKTVADLEPMLLKIKESEPTMNYPLCAVATYSPMQTVDFNRLVDYSIPAVMYQTGSDLKVHNMLEMPEMLDYFNVMHKFYQEGLVRKDSANTADYVPDLQAGKIFAFPTTTIPGIDVESEMSFHTPFVTVNMSPIVMTNGETMGGMNAISRTSKDPARAMMFLELLNTDVYLNNLINYGIEGVHYVKVSDNVIDFAPATNGGVDSGYNPSVQWEIGNQFINYLFKSEDPNKWKNYEAYNAQATPSNVLGFIFDQEPVKNEVAACRNVWQEYIPGLETGTTDPNTMVPKAIAKFKESGFDKIMVEAQKQYDAWRASK